MYLFIFCLEFSAVINSVFSVMWSVRNNCNMLICVLISDHFETK